jgi:hypothetical protein
MGVKGILSILVLPEVERFMKACIDAIAWSAMKVKANVEIVFVSHKYQLVDLFQNFRIKIEHFIFRDIPGSVEGQVPWICHGDPYEVKSPAGHPFKVILRCFVRARIPGRGGREEVKEVKTFPAGKRVRFSLGD